MERTRGYAGATEAYTSREAESKRQMRKDKTPAAAEPAMATTAVGGSKRARAPSAGRGLKDATAAANNKENKAPAAKRKAGMGGKDSAIPVPVAVEPEEAPVVPAALPAAEEAPAARESLGSTSSSVASVETSPVAKEEATAIPVAGSGAASPAAAMTATTGSSAAATTTSSSTVSFPLPVMKPADSVRLRGIAHKKVRERCTWPAATTGAAGAHPAHSGVLFFACNASFCVCVHVCVRCFCDLSVSRDVLRAVHGRDTGKEPQERPQGDRTQEDGECSKAGEGAVVSSGSERPFDCHNVAPFATLLSMLCMY